MTLERMRRSGSMMHAVQGGDHEVASTKLGGERYLLFDSGCAQCTEIAGSVEQESRGWLKARSLHDPWIQELLSRESPGWKWEPTLLEAHGDRSMVFTGFSMKIRLLVGLGPRRAARVARVVSRTGSRDLEVTLVPSQATSEQYAVESVRYMDRRSALRKMAAFGLGASVLPLLPSAALAEDDPDGTVGTAGRRRVRVYRFTDAEARDAARAVLQDPSGQKLDKSLRQRGFEPDVSQATASVAYTGTKASTGNIVTFGGRNGFTAYVPYSRGNQSALLHLRSKGPVSVGSSSVAYGRDNVRADCSIPTSNGGLDTFAVRDGAVRRVQAIKDLERARRRLRNQVRGAGASRITALNEPSSSCDICSLVVGAIVDNAIGAAFGSALAILVCTGLAAVCFPIVGVVVGILVSISVGYEDIGGGLCIYLGYC